MVAKKNINLRKRLMYQCTHRGTKELDIILGCYAKEKLKDFSEKQLKELDLILKCSDHSLFSYITKKIKPPSLIHNKTLRSIIIFNQNINNDV